MIQGLALIVGVVFPALRVDFLSWTLLLSSWPMLSPSQQLCPGKSLLERLIVNNISMRMQPPRMDQKAMMTESCLVLPCSAKLPREATGIQVVGKVFDRAANRLQECVANRIMYAKGAVAIILNKVSNHCKVFH